MNEHGAVFVLRAIQFAKNAHEGQVRKNSAVQPYIVHPIGVMARLAEAGFQDSPDLQAAAVLHDVLEDTPVTYAEVKQKFGNFVANVVRDVTNDPSLSQVAQKRKQVRKARSWVDNPAPRLIKLADKMDNCEDLLKDPPRKWSQERIRGYRVWSTWIIMNLKMAYDASTEKDAKEELLYEKAMAVCAPPDLDFDTIEEQVEQYYELLEQK